ncbi:hypothetical protein AQZ52_12950 [Novosphingobium fuchskuhlense]|uniref:Uncharacterized protein n=1 Tax=Novosphingobium fuchskuhlense TaxID=1117702 RepID=A0A117UU66_9SPHN|nr:hypothetical protein [Novosphingobium fuchskuhlense]KUR70929.1 hypothetical protein AQZ52_12950 [Novosphingobium fuchskuhlense]
MITPAERPSLLRLIAWIWHIRGEVPLPASLGADEAFDRLAPLFSHAGTTHARMGDVVSVSKKDQLAQDPLSVVDSGTLRIVPAGEGAVLRYHLVSRALLWCFLAPLLFLAVAQLTVFLGMLEKPKAAESAKKDAGKKDKKAEIQLNPVDKFLGAPAPEKPKDDKKDAKDKNKTDSEPEGFSPTPAYVFAGIFAALWLLGRLLEPWLIRRLFNRTLRG